MSSINARLYDVIEAAGLDPDCLDPTFECEGSQKKVFGYKGNGPVKRKVAKVPHVLLDETLDEQIDAINRSTSMDELLVKLYSLLSSCKKKIFACVGGEDLRTAQADSATVERYLGDWCEESIIHPIEERHSFVMEDVFIDHTRITMETLVNDPVVFADLKEIMNRIGMLIEHEGKWLDCMGFDPKRLQDFILRGIPYFDNLVRDTKTGHVRILERALYHRYSLHHVPLFLVQRKNAHAFGLPFGE